VLGAGSCQESPKKTDPVRVWDEIIIWMVIGSVAIGIGLSEARRRLAGCSAESECLE